LRVLCSFGGRLFFCFLKAQIYKNENKNEQISHNLHSKVAADLVFFQKKKKGKTG
jgi:hypothetical protein